MILSAALGAAVFGVDPNQTQGLQLASALFGVLGVALFTGVRWQPHLKLQRIVPGTITMDSPTSYTVMITNQSDKPEIDLVLSDFLRGVYPSVDDFQNQDRNQSEANLNWFDRRVGFPRWLNLLHKNRGARLQAVAVPTIPAHGTVTVTIVLKPLRRGKLVFTGFELKRPDPLGIFFAKHRIDQYDELISLPKRYSIQPFILNSEQHFHRGRVVLAAAVGDSEEFIGLREYRPGDPLRHIHWRSFAKRGTPVVKEHQDDYVDRHALVIDTFLGTSSTDDFEAAVSIAASLIQAAQPSASTLDSVFIEHQIWHLTSGRGFSNNRQVLLQLAELQPTGHDRFMQLSEYLRRYLERLASVIIVSADWDASRQSFVDELHSRHVRCTALCARETKSTDDSTGQIQRVNPTYIRPSFIEQDIATVGKHVV